MSVRRHRILTLAAAPVLLLAAGALAIYWFQAGPGLEGEVARLASAAGIEPGMTVGEIGAGKGRMAARMAHRIGPRGRLYATEIDEGRLELLRHLGEPNITVVRAGVDSTKLPDACCDAIYLRRVYHHFTDPAAMNRSMHRSLRPGGRLAIIDFDFPGWLLIRPHGVPLDMVLAQAAAAGFALEKRLDRWSPVEYCLVFRKRSR
jgi:ubiquinone/menaquinone biosynthesis C-methylase UbiE